MNIHCQQALSTYVKLPQKQKATVRRRAVCECYFRINTTTESKQKD